MAIYLGFSSGYLCLRWGCEKHAGWNTHVKRPNQVHHSTCIGNICNSVVWEFGVFTGLSGPPMGSALQEMYYNYYIYQD
jgi:hypothetical protein